MSEPYDLFTAVEKRDEAIERADASVTTAHGGDALIGRITQRIVDAYPVGSTFSVDAVGRYLDDAGVPRDLATRRRLVSTIVNRGKGKLWRHVGYAASHDPRRNARPVAQWERLGATGVVREGQEEFEARRPPSVAGQVV